MLDALSFPLSVAHLSVAWNAAARTEFAALEQNQNAKDQSSRAHSVMAVKGCGG